MVSRPDLGVSRGLAPRMALASALLALIVGVAFAVLLIAISSLRAALVLDHDHASAASIACMSVGSSGRPFYLWSVPGSNR
jgi:uncharacterized membrane protein